ncbi:hypothetical protein ECDEC14A_4800 [Escherichia coli DEC14A]|nr:hypothetical protein ECDEC14A_4800 [Escherichia coli DEC14A]
MREHSKKIGVFYLYRQGGYYFVFPDVSVLNAFLSFIKMASYP